jgi:hypothetical protein
MSSTKHSGRDLLTAAFILTTLALLVVTSIGTANYVRFYSAITQVRVSIASIKMTPASDASHSILVQVIFAIENPSDYNGFFVQNFQSALDIIGVSPTGNLTAHQGTLPYPSTTGRLDPGSIIKERLPAFNTSTSFATNPSTKISYVFHLNFVLSTFLNKIALVIPTYDCLTSGAPTACQQTGVSIQTPGWLGRGGGGGA